MIFWYDRVRVVFDSLHEDPAGCFSRWLLFDIHMFQLFNGYAWYLVIMLYFWRNNLGEARIHFNSSLKVTDVYTLNLNLNENNLSETYFECTLYCMFFDGGNTSRLRYPRTDLKKPSVFSTSSFVLSKYSSIISFPPPGLALQFEMEIVNVLTFDRGLEIYNLCGWKESKHASGLHHLYVYFKCCKMKRKDFPEYSYSYTK